MHSTQREEELNSTLFLSTNVIRYLFSICCRHGRRQELLQTTIPINEIALHLKRRKTQLLWPINQSIDHLRWHGLSRSPQNIVFFFKTNNWVLSLLCSRKKRFKEPPLQTKNSSQRNFIPPEEKRNSTYSDQPIKHTSNLWRHGQPNTHSLSLSLSLQVS